MNVLYRSLSKTVCNVNEIMNGRIHLVACMLMNNAKMLGITVSFRRLQYVPRMLSLTIPKEYSEAVNLRRGVNAMDKCFKILRYQRGNQKL